MRTNSHYYGVYDNYFFMIHYVSASSSGGNAVAMWNAQY